MILDTTYMQSKLLRLQSQKPVVQRPDWPPLLIPVIKALEHDCRLYNHRNTLT